MKNTILKILILFVPIFASHVQVHAEGDWQVDFEQVVQQAKEENKHILLYFTGSTWCPPCMRLGEEVLNKEEFENFAAEELVLMKMDFDSRGRPRSEDFASQHNSLKHSLRIRSYPSLVLLSPDAEYIDRTGYRRGGAEAYVEHIKEIIGEDG